VTADVPATNTMPMLEVSGLRRTFGGLTAVDVDRLAIPRNTITALIGPNGAGKTTLFNLLTGFDKPDGGSWRFDGRDMSGLSAYRVARLGMVRTFQLTKSLARLTVLENMLLGAPGQKGERLLPALFHTWRTQERENTERAHALLERFKLADKQRDLAGTLSGGQRKLLEMARALMVDPKLIMLDEPMAGVNPALVQSLLEHIKELRTEGRTVVFVEHDMDVVMNISDWVVCMAEGHVIAEAVPSEIVANEAVIEAYLGLRHGEDA
jgi:branched-chain amino acid transport system ATP-binding protein